MPAVRRAESQSFTVSTKASSVAGSVPPSASPSACSARGSSAGSRSSSAIDALAQRQRVAVEQGERARARCPRRPRRPPRSRRRRGSRRSRPRPRAPTSSTGSGRSVSSRQRERMVGRTRRRRVADQQQQRALRRLLQNLQQRIGACGLQFVDGVDDADAPAPLARRSSRRTRRCGARRRPGSRVRSLPVFSLIVRSSTSRSRCACAAMRRATGCSASTASEVACLHRRRRPDRDGRARSAPCGRRASPCRCRRAADQPGMRDAAAAIGVEQRAARPPRGRTARWSRADAAARRLRLRRPPRSRGRVLERDRGGRGIEPLVDHLPDPLGDRRFRRRRVDQHAAVRARCSEQAEGLAQLLVKRRPIPPRSGRRCRRRAACWRARARSRPARRG